MIQDQEQTTSLPVYTPKDFTSDQDVRWCPGCGDYAILKAVQKTLPKLKHRKEDYVFVSGIGCAARFPYYMDTYGVHSIHGRGLAVATGVKLANPELQVIVVSGDGDLLSIGGNHTIHLMRRNIDMTVLLLNNRIYGLTKGQYSPTSEVGKITASTPEGSLDNPINPLALVAAAGCTFIARCIDIDMKAMDTILQRAIAHKGTAFIEVYQDCNIYNHEAWFYASKPESKQETTVALEQGKPLIFGKDRDKGIRLVNGMPQVVRLDENGVNESDLLIHDETNQMLAYVYSQMTYPDLPEPIGILHADPTRPTYDSMASRQLEDAVAAKGPGDLHRLLQGEETWEVQ